MDQIGVVWNKTYGPGYIFNLKPVAGGGYVAAGWIWGTTPTSVGLIMEIDESGNEIRRATATIPQTYINYPGTDTYLAATPDRILRINSSLDATSTMINSMSLPDVTNPYANSITPSLDGGFYLNNSNIATVRYTSGVGIYKVDYEDKHVYNKRDIPADSIFDAPLSLPGSAVPAKYIGAMRASLGGYYIWSGDPDDGFVTILQAMDINGNRIIASSPAILLHPSNADH